MHLFLPFFSYYFRVLTYRVPHFELTNQSVDISLGVLIPILCMVLIIVHLWVRAGLWDVAPVGKSLGCLLNLVRRTAVLVTAQ